MVLLKLLTLGWQEKYLPIPPTLIMFPPDGEFVFEVSNVFFLYILLLNMHQTPQFHLYSLGIGLQKFCCNLQLTHLLLVIYRCPCPAFCYAINLLLSCYV